MDSSAMDGTVSDMNQAPVEQVPQSNERTFRQSELNEIVGRAKHDAVESFKRQQAQHQTSQNHAAHEPTHAQRSLSEDDVKRLTSEELARQREEWDRQNLERYQTETAKRIVNSYQEKIAAGKDKYQDFDEVVNTVDMRDFSNIVQLLADHVDNAHDVLYSLAQRPGKMDELDRLFERKPQYAINEVKRLAESIKANESSSKLKTSNAPLSQQRPSNTGTDSGGALSMKDLKAKYRA